MKRAVVVLSLAVVCVALVATTTLLGAVNHRYVESFSTSAYKDPGHTTAWWDTISGQAKLYPFAMTLLGTCHALDDVHSVVLEGNYAYISNTFRGLLVVDVRDPMNPVVAGTCPSPGSGWAAGVTVAGDYAYMGRLFPGGFDVISISDPTHPVLVRSLATVSGVDNPAVAGDYLYLPLYDSGLQIYGISDPTNPVAGAFLPLPGHCAMVQVSGKYAYVAARAGGLQVIDIADPAHPTVAGSYHTAGEVYGLAVEGDYAYLADWLNGFHVIDISDPTHPTLAGSCATPGTARSVFIDGNYAYVTCGDEGLQMIDISDPAHPTIVQAIDTPNSFEEVAVAGDLAYVTNIPVGLQVIHISDPVNPSRAGSCSTPFYAYDIAIAGDNAHIADGPLGFLAMDISDPTHPSLVGSCATAYALAVAIDGDYACVADYDSGLKVIDISDPTHPTLMGTYDTPGISYDVAISGDYAYLADGGSGLLVIDISNPAHPTLAGSCGAPDGASGVVISGDYAYVANGYGGFMVINIRNPVSPVLAGSLYTGGLAYDVTVAGDYAFTADAYSGLQIISISDPNHPTLTGNYNTPCSANGVTISGDRAYVADALCGLQVIDISNPASPVLAGSYDTPGESRKVVIDGDLAYVADGPPGIQVLQVYQRFVDRADNKGQSLVINSLHEEMVKAKLSASQSDSILWEISANGGTNWEELTPNGAWRSIAVPGSDLIWRSTHQCAQYRTNPACTQLALDWLYNFAVIDSIVDVPNDQGGWVRAHFTRSGRDFADEATHPISNYGIWRRVDSAALVAALVTRASTMVEKSPADNTPKLGGLPVITYQGRTYVHSGPGFAASSFPPGTWELVMSVPAIQQDAYITAVPTAADSSASGTNHTVFVVTAHTTTPSIWYVSEPDSGYSVDNIAPGVPMGFAVAYNTGSGNHLSWDPLPDKDFQYFRVYRSNDPNFIPSPSELIHSTIETSWSDPDYDGWNVYYKITALDYVGNESDPASPGTVTGVTQSTIPQAYGLYPNVPNPFNPSTSIRYDVPAGGGVVMLRIYDVSGRLIRTLADGPQTAGQKTVTWNGRDDRGRNVSSGVYFYRLQAPGYKKTLKMILVQ